MFESDYLSEADKPIRLGVSSCLIGDEVRYDGNHKKDHYIIGTLSQYFDLVPFCPEVAIGLGVPREPIHLIKEDDSSIRVKGVTNKTQDVTDELKSYAQKAVTEAEGISGYIFKSKSPSCGLTNIPLHNNEGQKLEGQNATGVYAQRVIDHRPNLPVEDEGRLGQQAFRENFIQRVFVYHRWQSLVKRGLTARELVVFHTHHKFILMAHSEAALKETAKLILDLRQGDLTKLSDQYITLVMDALKEPATIGKNVNVLQHLTSHVRKYLDKHDLDELNGVIDSYYDGKIPMVVPVTLLRHHVNKSTADYVEAKYFLNPDPQELMLRESLLSD